MKIKLVSTTLFSSFNIFLVPPKEIPSLPHIQVPSSIFKSLVPYSVYLKIPTILTTSHKLESQITLQAFSLTPTHHWVPLFQYLAQERRQPLSRGPSLLAWIRSYDRFLDGFPVPRARYNRLPRLPSEAQRACVLLR